MKDHNWGKITADGQKLTRDGELVKMDFLGKISSFISILNGAQESINEKVILRVCEKYDLSAVHTLSDMQAIALSKSNIDTLAAIEDTVGDWYAKFSLKSILEINNLKKIIKIKIITCLIIKLTKGSNKSNW
jgi:dynein heavy chain